MRRPRRDWLNNYTAVRLDENGTIVNDLPANVYLPRDAGRRERLLWALRQARINKEASRV